MSQKVKYVVYDLETVPDLELFQQVKYPKAPDARTAVNRYACEQVEKGYLKEGETPFIPTTFHYPVSAVVLKLASDFSPIGVPIVLGGPAVVFDRSRAVVEQFWAGVKMYRPTLVDFNGRTFDIPVLTMRAFALGIACPTYFAPDRFGYRYRYTDKHIDLMDWMTAHGAFRLTGGLDLCAKLVGGQGKTGTSGADVADLWHDGKVKEIDDYCTQDVIDTYRVFLRTRVLTGELLPSREKEFLEEVAS